MVDIPWLLVIGIAAHGYGVVLARALGLSLRDRLERITITIGLGAGLILVATFLLALVKVIGRGPSLVMVLPAAAFGAWRLVSAPGEKGPSIQPRWLGIGLYAAIGLCVAANIIGTLAPPTFIDALFYHLFIPRAYLRAGGVVQIPYIWQSYQPLGVEMFFALGLSIRGAVLAALMHAGLGVLAASGTWLLGRRVAGPLGGLLAVAIFYCTAMVAWESTSCFVELGITAFATLGVYCLLRWKDDRSWSWLITAALLIGAATTCKLTAVQLPAVCAVLIVWIQWRAGQRLSATLGRAALFVAIALSFSVPWYVHSYLWTGNPVYPFAAGIFGANPDYHDVWSILSHYGPGHGFGDIVLAPWRLFSNGAIFECGQFFSPLPFIFAPLILVRLRASQDRQLLAAAVAMLFVIWLATAHVARYLIPLQTLAAVLAADAMIWAASVVGKRLHARLLFAIGALLVGFGTLSTLLFLRTLAPVVFGRESVESYLSRTAAFYTTYRQVMNDVPPDALILTNQGPTYYLDRPHQRMRDADFFVGSDRLAQVIAAGKFTHILLHDHPEIEPAILALGPRVRLLWHRDLDTPVSRTFGGTMKVPSFLFEVVR
jgi:hypothetical protein